MITYSDKNINFRYPRGTAHYKNFKFTIKAYVFKGSPKKFSNLLANQEHSCKNLKFSPICVCIQIIFWIGYYETHYFYQVKFFKTPHSYFRLNFFLIFCINSNPLVFSFFFCISSTIHHPFFYLIKQIYKIK